MNKAGLGQLTPSMLFDLLEAVDFASRHDEIVVMVVDGRVRVEKSEPPEPARN